ncbi:MAG: hypothetical protein RI897_4107 [Verrucomicrobiota bacterium]
MDAFVGGVPVLIMGEEDNIGGVFLEDICGDFDGVLPEVGVFGSGRGADFFEAAGCGGDQVKADGLAAGLEFLEASELSVGVTAEGNGHVSDLVSGFAEQAEGDATDDDLVIGVG